MYIRTQEVPLRFKKGILSIGRIGRSRASTSATCTGPWVLKRFLTLRCLHFQKGGEIGEYTISRPWCLSPIYPDLPLFATRINAILDSI